MPLNVVLNVLCCNCCSGKRLPVERPRKPSDSGDLIFKALLLPGAHDANGFQSTMLIQDRVLTIRSTVRTIGHDTPPHTKVVMRFV